MQHVTLCRSMSHAKASLCPPALLLFMVIAVAVTAATAGDADRTNQLNSTPALKPQAQLVAKQNTTSTTHMDRRRTQSASAVPMSSSANTILKPHESAAVSTQHGSQLTPSPSTNPTAARIVVHEEEATTKGNNPTGSLPAVESTSSKLPDSAVPMSSSANTGRDTQDSAAVSTQPQHGSQLTPSPSTNPTAARIVVHEEEATTKGNNPTVFLPAVESTSSKLTGAVPMSSSANTGRDTQDSAAVSTQPQHGSQLTPSPSTNPTAARIVVHEEEATTKGNNPTVFLPAVESTSSKLTGAVPMSSSANTGRDTQDSAAVSTQPQHGSQLTPSPSTNPTAARIVVHEEEATTKGNNPTGSLPAVESTSSKLTGAVPMSSSANTGRDTQDSAAVSTQPQHGSQLTPSPSTNPTAARIVVHEEEATTKGNNPTVFLPAVESTSSKLTGAVPMSSSANTGRDTQDSAAVSTQPQHGSQLTPSPSTNPTAARIVVHEEEATTKGNNPTVFLPAVESTSSKLTGAVPMSSSANTGRDTQDSAAVSTQPQHGSQLTPSPSTNPTAARIVVHEEEATTKGNNPTVFLPAVESTSSKLTGAVPMSSSANTGRDTQDSAAVSTQPQHGSQLTPSPSTNPTAARIVVHEEEATTKGNNPTGSLPAVESTSSKLPDSSVPMSSSANTGRDTQDSAAVSTQPQHGSQLTPSPSTNPTAARIVVHEEEATTKGNNPTGSLPAVESTSSKLPDSSVPMSSSANTGRDTQDSAAVSTQPQHGSQLTPSPSTNPTAARIVVHEEEATTKGNNPTGSLPAVESTSSKLPDSSVPMSSSANTGRDTQDSAAVSTQPQHGSQLTPSPSTNPTAARIVVHEEEATTKGNNPTGSLPAVESTSSKLPDSAVPMSSSANTILTPHESAAVSTHPEGSETSQVQSESSLEESEKGVSETPFVTSVPDTASDPSLPPSSHEEGPTTAADALSPDTDRGVEATFLATSAPRSRRPRKRRPSAPLLSRAVVPSQGSIPPDVSSSLFSFGEGYGFAALCGVMILLPVGMAACYFLNRNCTWRGSRHVLRAEPRRASPQDEHRRMEEGTNCDSTDQPSPKEQAVRKGITSTPPLRGDNTRRKGNKLFPQGDSKV